MGDLLKPLEFKNSKLAEMMVTVERNQVLVYVLLREEDRRLVVSYSLVGTFMLNFHGLEILIK